MAGALLASTYSTPGRRAFGDLGTVPEGEAISTWGSINFAGLQIAAGVRMERADYLRAPCFINATHGVKGGPRTGVMLVRMFVHPFEQPDIIVALGECNPAAVAVICELWAMGRGMICTYYCRLEMGKLKI